jgi:hypothetical protein
MKYLLALLLAAQLCLAATIHPIETDEFLSNPGIGWMTMFGAATYGAPVPDGVESTISYVRIDWKDVHTGKGRYDWDRIDSEIEAAEEGGQQIMLRLMPVWESSGSPYWMQSAGYDGFSCSGKWVVDLDDSRVQEDISDFLQELGVRYNNHPGVDSIEINFLGCWGEGNWACCGNQPPEPSMDTLRFLADEHYDNFPDLPVIGPVAGWGITRYMYDTYRDTRGAGIFMDCWGDYGMSGPDWNHMEVGYPEWLNDIHSGSNWDSWKHGLIKLEPCGTMRDWTGDIDRSLEWAIDNHASIIGNKNENIPSGYDDEIREALKKIGYRLVLRELEHYDTASAGQDLSIRFYFENIGNAPPYKDYYLAVKLDGPETETIVSDASVKYWLPGKHEETVDFELPGNLPSGQYTLSIGLMPAYVNKPKIKLAIEGKDSSGWYPLSELTISSDPNCGNSVCNAGECSTCPSDCAGQCCGDGKCSSSENCSSCPADCKVKSGQICCSGDIFTGVCCKDLDCDGACINHKCQESAFTQWKVIYSDSEEPVNSASKAIDKDPNTFWHTEYSDNEPGYPHEIQIDLGDEMTLTGFTYLPRQDNYENGNIRNYEFYLSNSRNSWGTPVKGIFTSGKKLKTVTFLEKSGRYIRLKAINEINGNPWANIAELDIITAPAEPKVAKKQDSSDSTIDEIPPKKPEEPVVEIIELKVYHPADKNKSGCIEIIELALYVIEWKKEPIPAGNVLEALIDWKSC